MSRQAGGFAPPRLAAVARGAGLLGPAVKMARAEGYQGWGDHNECGSHNVSKDRRPRCSAREGDGIESPGREMARLAGSSPAAITSLIPA